MKTYREICNDAETVMLYELGANVDHIPDDDISALVQWFENACIATNTDPMNDFTGGTICRAIRNAYFAGYDDGFAKGLKDGE